MFTLTHRPKRRLETDGLQVREEETMNLSAPFQIPVRPTKRVQAEGGCDSDRVDNDTGTTTTIPEVEPQPQLQPRDTHRPHPPEDPAQMIAEAKAKLLATPQKAEADRILKIKAAKQRADAILCAALETEKADDVDDLNMFLWKLKAMNTVEPWRMPDPQEEANQDGEMGETFDYVKRMREQERLWEQNQEWSRR